MAYTTKVYITAVSEHETKLQPMEKKHKLNIFCCNFYFILLKRSHPVSQDTTGVNLTAYSFIILLHLILIMNAIF